MKVMVTPPDRVEAALEFRNRSADGAWWSLKVGSLAALRDLVAACADGLGDAEVPDA